MNRSILACACLLLGGCLDSADGPSRFPDTRYWWSERSSPPPLPAPGYCSDFTAELRILDSMGQPETTFMQREPVRIEVHVTNTGDEAVTLMTGSGPQTIIEVVNHQNLVVAGNTVGLLWPAVPVPFPYGPGETQIVEWTWDQRMRNDFEAPIGDYTVHADDWTECRSVLGRSAVIRIR